MTTTDTVAAAAEELSGRVFMAGLATIELAGVWLGMELGLYERLQRSGPQTPGELARTAGVDARYVREWLQSQAISGFVTLTGDDVDSGTYDLVPGVVEVLIDETSPFFTGGLAQVLTPLGRVLPRLPDAYRRGEGVAYDAYGPEAVSAQAALNRPSYVNSLVTEWLPRVPDLWERLTDTTNPARVADQCTGVGWSAIELAKAMPHVTIDGFDNDEESIIRARRYAAEHGVADRVNFEVRDVADGTGIEDRYDVVFVFEAIHDLPHPVEALANLARLAKPNGTVIVMDERVAEELTVPGDEIERFMAAVSVVWCTPQGRVNPDSDVIGTVMRPATFERVAHEAGFSKVEVLDIEHPFFRFYRPIR